MGNIRLFIKLMSISVRSQMQYRASFFMLAFSLFLSSFVGIAGIWILFDRFKLVAGWNFAEVAVLYGIVHMGFAISEAFARGLDKFDQLLIMGDFDRLLLRPAGTLFQVAASQVQLMRIGRFLQGLFVFSLGIHELGISLFSYQLFVLVLAIFGTAALFYGLLVLQATIAFWTTESLELMNIATYGGLEACQFPITIYPMLFQIIFTYIIPLACVSYFPASTILGHSQNPYAWLFPFAGVIFLAAMCFFWNFGVRRYTSTGS